VPGEAELVDFGLVADVEQVDGRMLEALWGAGLVPLLSSLVVDAHGQLLNLNADTLVTALTERVRFDDVVLLTGVPGVYRDLEDKGSHLPELLDTDVRTLIDSGAVQGGMVVKLEEVAAILQRGANAVWIVGFQQPGAVTAALAGQPGLRTVVRAAVK
jgi:acetylglutamate kinase